MMMITPSSSQQQEQETRIVFDQYSPSERSFSAVVQQCGAWDEELASVLTSPSGIPILSFV
jgi:hypothetical protein